MVETVNGERRVATAAMTELPVPFAFGVLRRRRNRLLSTTMPTPRHATGGEFPKMIMAGELWAHCTPSRRGKAEPHRSLTVTVQKARALPGLGHTTMWKLISTGVLETRKIGR